MVPLLAGEVSGRVIGPSGEPIARAQVYAFSIDTPGIGRPTEVLTSQKGEFRLTAVRPGRNEIHAYAPQLGYPNNLYAIFQTAPIPVVQVKESAATSGVVVHLGPKPGQLAGEIVDKKTGKPLPDAAITLTRADRPELYVRSSVEQNGSFTFYVPAIPLLITATCPGYRDWRSLPLAVGTSDSQRLKIQLEH